MNERKHKKNILQNIYKGVNSLGKFFFLKNYEVYLYLEANLCFHTKYKVCDYLVMAKNIKDIV